MQNNILIIISLLFAVSLLSMLSNKLRVAYPILLVIAGLIIGAIPDIPNISLDPELVFIIFLPPLLYSAAWNTSWREFWLLRRPIGLLAFGLVIFTSCAIAILSNALIAGFTLPLGFVLGGVISPPDAIAATSVISKLKVPRRVVTILEGESLVNDASSLIVFRFALIAVATGQFILWKAGLNFLLVAGMGIFTGLAIAAVIYLIHRFLPTDPAIDTGISLMTPYLMYMAAEHFGYSGVLAVVSGGLFLSKYAHHYLNYDSRLQIKSVWNTLVFLLNGVVFILIGMQLPFILQGLESYSLTETIGYAIIISLASVAIRILWVFPATYLPRIMSKKIKNTERRPDWKSVFIVAWSGMRGVVSLASALTIPVALESGELFPHRNLILFITFSVILFTLVLQGLSLPLLISVLKIKINDGNTEEQQLKINRQLAQAALEYLNTNYATEIEKNDGHKRIKERYERVTQETEQQIKEYPQRLTGRRSALKLRVTALELIRIQRKQLEKLHKEDQFNNELLKNKEYELDLEEARIRRIGL